MIVSIYISLLEIYVLPLHEFAQSIDCAAHFINSKIGQLSIDRHMVYRL